jgi:hypothetical protein
LIIGLYQETLKLDRNHRLKKETLRHIRDTKRINKKDMQLYIKAAYLFWQRTVKMIEVLPESFQVTLFDLSGNIFQSR